MKLKKRFWGLFVVSSAVLVMAFSSVAFSYWSSDYDYDVFTDVSTSHENYYAISFLYNLDTEPRIIEGYAIPDSTLREYRPDNSINRAEFLKLLLEGTGFSISDSYSSCFPDVATGLWYTKYVCYAKEEGMINGYPDGTFKPAQTINEAEALKILGEVEGWDLPAISSTGAPWYQPYLTFANGRNIVPHTDVSVLMTRGDIAEIIFRDLQVLLMDVEEFSEDLIDEMFVQFIEVGVVDVDMDMDTDTDGDDLLDEEIAISVTGIQDLYASNGSDSASLEFVVTDVNDVPLTGRDLMLTAYSGTDMEIDVPVVEEGDGVYTADFSSESAGDFTLTLSDLESGYETVFYITVEPASLDHVNIFEVTYPNESDSINKAYLKVAAQDKYDNILLYSSTKNNLSAVSTLGSVEVSHDNYGIFTIELTADDWGEADVTIVDANTDISYGETWEIFFLPIQVVMPKGIEETENQIEADIYLYLPDDRGKLGSYNFDLVFTDDNLTFADVVDPDDSDNFDTPSVILTESGLNVAQMNNESSDFTPEVVHAGTLLLDVESVGGGSIYVGDAVLTNALGEEVDYLESFGNWISETAESLGTTVDEAQDAFFEGVWRWWYNVKPIIDVCIDVFIFPGDGVTANDVTRDILNANAIFARIAANCNCNFYLNVVLNSVITTLTAADWAAVDTNGDGNLDENEMDNTVNNHPAGNNCVPIYYVPAIHGGDLGWSWEGPPTEGIAIDGSEDGDNRTLAHELAHQLSQGEVEDTGDPNAAGQGANDPGNLMNANNIGDDLTVNQCGLIEKYVNP